MLSAAHSICRAGGIALSLSLLAATAIAQTAAPHLDHRYPNYQPRYPDAAQVNAEQGDVVLDVEVTSSGRVRHVQIEKSSGFPDLDNAAIAGVLSWRYVPATEDGDAVTGWTTVTISYRLPTVSPPPPKA